MDRFWTFPKWNRDGQLSGSFPDPKEFLIGVVVPKISKPQTLGEKLNADLLTDNVKTTKDGRPYTSPLREHNPIASPLISDIERAKKKISAISESIYTQERSRQLSPTSVDETDFSEGATTINHINVSRDSFTGISSLKSPKPGTITKNSRTRTSTKPTTTSATTATSASFRRELRIQSPTATTSSNSSSGNSTKYSLSATNHASSSFRASMFSKKPTGTITSTHKATKNYQSLSTTERSIASTTSPTTTRKFLSLKSTTTTNTHSKKRETNPNTSRDIVKKSITSSHHHHSHQATSSRHNSSSSSSSRQRPDFSSPGRQGRSFQNSLSPGVKTGGLRSPQGKSGAGGGDDKPPSGRANINYRAVYPGYGGGGWGSQPTSVITSPTSNKSSHSTVTSGHNSRNHSKMEEKTSLLAHHGTSTGGHRSTTSGTTPSSSSSSSGKNLSKSLKSTKNKLMKLFDATRAMMSSGSGSTASTNASVATGSNGDSRTSISCINSSRKPMGSLSPKGKSHHNSSATVDLERELQKRRAKLQTSKTKNVKPRVSTFFSATDFSSSTSGTAGTIASSRTGYKTESGSRRVTTRDQQRGDYDVSTLESLRKTFEARSQALTSEIKGMKTSAGTSRSDKARLMASATSRNNSHSSPLYKLNQKLSSTNSSNTRFTSSRSKVV